MNDMTVIYEQQTANLVEIARELEQQEQYQDIASMLTIGNIAKAAKRLREYEKENRKENCKRLTICKNLELKKVLQKQNEARRKTVLSIKQQNLLNVRRIENANKSKGSE